MIKVPSWAVTVIGAAVGYLVGLVVADDITAYWRPALAPLLTAVGSIFVAAPLGARRLEAKRQQGADQTIELLREKRRQQRKS